MGVNCILTIVHQSSYKYFRSPLRLLSLLIQQDLEQTQKADYVRYGIKEKHSRLQKCLHFTHTPI